MECKFWLDSDNFEITIALEYNLTPQSKREIKRIIYEHFDYIVSEWNKFFNNQNMEKAYTITEIRFENDSLLLIIDDQLIKIQLSDVSDKLMKATEEERNDFKISPSGYGIHWKLIDEDLSINGLLKGQTKHSLQQR
jgi:hypothetical protein